MKPGPGLFSGEDGVFTLYGNPEASGAEKTGVEGGQTAADGAVPSPD